MHTPGDVPTDLEDTISQFNTVVVFWMIECLALCNEAQFETPASPPRFPKNQYSSWFAVVVLHSDLLVQAPCLANCFTLLRALVEVVAITLDEAGQGCPHPPKSEHSLLSSIDAFPCRTFVDMPGHSANLYPFVQMMQDPFGNAVC